MKLTEDEKAHLLAFAKKRESEKTKKTRVAIRKIQKEINRQNISNAEFARRCLMTRQNLHIILTTRKITLKALDQIAHYGMGGVDPTSLLEQVEK